MSDLVSLIAEAAREEIMRQAPDLAYTGISIDCTVLAELLVDRLNLHEERREDVKKIPEGLDIVVEARTGTSCRGWCNQCAYGTAGYVSPREAWDWAYEHAEKKHGYKPTAQTRLVSGWTEEQQQ